MVSGDVSVVIRSCGRAALLRRAFASLEAQTVSPREIILVGIGASGIEAATTAHPPSTIRLVPVPEGRIRGGALNDGVRACKSPWIAFLDDDDSWAPTFLEEMLIAAEGPSSHQDFGGIICRTEAVYERVQGGLVTPCGQEPFNPRLEQVNAKDLFQKNRFTINAALWRRSVIDAVGGFSEALPVLEDWDFNLRVAVRFKLVVLPRSLARYHLRPRTDPVPNTRMREHGRIAAQLQREWFRARVLGSRNKTGRWQQMIWLATASFSRGRARFGDWRRWRALCERDEHKSS